MRETTTIYKNIGVEEALHKKMKIQAVIRGMSLRDFYNEVIRQFLTISMATSSTIISSEVMNDAD